MNEVRDRRVKGPKASEIEPYFNRLASFKPSSKSMSAASKILLICDYFCEYMDSKGVALSEPIEAGLAEASQLVEAESGLGDIGPVEFDDPIDEELSLSSSF